MLRKLAGIIVGALLSFQFVSAADTAPKKDFKVCWSIYVGWMPWGYLSDSGIMKKWADKYGINVEITRIPWFGWAVCTRTTQAARETAGDYDGFIGTPAEVIEQLEAYIALGFDYFMLCSPKFPDPTSIELLKSEVIPVLQAKYNGSWPEKHVAVGHRAALSPKRLNRNVENCAHPTSYESRIRRTGGCRRLAQLTPGSVADAQSLAFQAACAIIAQPVIARETQGCLSK